jgi:hypothetical protein
MQVCKCAVVVNDVSTIMLIQWKEKNDNDSFIHSVSQKRSFPCRPHILWREHTKKLNTFEKSANQKNHNKQQISKSLTYEDMKTNKQRRDRCCSQ